MVRFIKLLVSICICTHGYWHRRRCIRRTIQFLGFRIHVQVDLVGNFKASIIIKQRQLISAYFPLLYCRSSQFYPLLSLDG